jgi:hypothetical protein
MIIAKLQGGLGNQMFQYAFGRALSIKHSVELKLDKSMFPTYKYHKCMINHFKVDAPYANSLEIIRFNIHRRRPNWPWKFLNPVLHNPNKYVQEPSYYFRPDLLEIKDSCLLDGYWLCEKYFIDIEDSIRSEFKIHSPLNEYTKNMKNKIQSVTHPVMLHVRRADFAKDFIHVHGTLSLAYYERAISIIKERLPNASFFIFSDDPKWAQSHIKPNSPTEYIGQGADLNYLDLYLMSQCEHFILANSTFGWWGAWLSKSYRKNITIMPKYMTAKMDTRDLAHSSWIIIDDLEYSARKVTKN